ncbi:kinase-like domain-containing protein [Aspergillus terricola var. indicus]
MDYSKVQPNPILGGLGFAVRFNKSNASCNHKGKTLPHYKAAHYYPVRIGDVYHARYEVAGKLGYGAYSTSWLCQDLQAKNYRVLKVSTSLPDYPTATDRELRVYEHPAKVDSSHPGQSLIRELYDSFDLQGPGGTHRCLRLLLALDFLQAEAKVIHADLKTDNLTLSLEDSSMLADFATAESEKPEPSEAIDIWNLAGFIWDLFEGQHLFGDIFDPRGGHDPLRHLALMVALVGPPPTEFVRRSETTEQCFDSRGDWIAHHEAPVPSVSLETLETRLTGKEKELFLAFIRSMLKWMPEERKTAKQLLEHPYLSQIFSFHERLAGLVMFKERQQRSELC